MSSELDPQLAAVVADIEAAGVPAWHAMSVECARRVEDEVFAGDATLPVGLVRDLAFDGPHGGVPVRVYVPDDAEAEPPVLVYFHGGGWTLGTLDSIDGVCRRLARQAGCVVVSVDYRLAPEHPFPVAVDEAAAAVEWVGTNAAAFGGDPSRIGVAGTSAGGNLAAAVCLRVREFDGPAIAGQFLCYPITDRDFETDSYRENADGPLLTRADMRWFWAQYLRSPVDAHNPFAAPLRAVDLGGLPPATVVTAGFDPLRDEAIAYADRLSAAGVAVEHRHYPRMAHGFLSLVDEVDVAADAFEALVGDVRRHLG
ncbi:alpha/beta hydrolase [Haloferacaceae archaeon DSL9]